MIAGGTTEYISGGQADTYANITDCNSGSTPKNNLYQFELPHYLHFLRCELSSGFLWGEYHAPAFYTLSA